ncbi:MAG: DUF2628 domain-containing protein [Oscillospiraceae bacterium]|jgi:ribosomal protein L40E|nr:DUF2628 domain-containing protein [Oscillospiraceae bacterium]
MDYTDLKCEACGKIFEQDDDIVVCPDCGTPQHRECYEANNACVFESKHKDGFVYEDFLREKVRSGELNWSFCNKCGTPNRPNAAECQKCGRKMSNPAAPQGQPFVYGRPTVPNDNKNANEDTEKNGTPQNGGFGGFAGGFNPFFNFAVDDEPINDVTKEHIHDYYEPTESGQKDTNFSNSQMPPQPDAIPLKFITMGDMAKYVKTNILYYLEVFKRIKAFGKTKFNFAAFFFSGGYFLYRKMYKLGTVLTIFYVAMLGLQMLFSASPIYTEALEIFKNSGLSINSFEHLTQQQAFYFVMPSVCMLLRLAIMAICGAIANRCYYNHCAAKIYGLMDKAGITFEAETANAQPEEQSENAQPSPPTEQPTQAQAWEDFDSLLQTSGGINSSFGIVALLLFVYGFLLTIMF